MAVNQRLSTRRKRQIRKQNSRLTEHEQALNILEEVKEQSGKVIHVPVNGRTTIELPADMPKEEIKKRIERYKTMRGLKV